MMTILLLLISHTDGKLMLLAVVCPCIWVDLNAVTDPGPRRIINIFFFLNLTSAKFAFTITIPYLVIGQ